MAGASFWAPCLVLVSSFLPTVYAQSIPAPNCNVATNTISSQSDADALISCSSLGGSLTITANYSGSLSLPNVQTIRGDIIASSCPSLTQISMPSLGNADSLQLNNLANLTEISFPALTYINNLYLTSLPSINSINLNASNQGTYRPSMSNWTIHNTSLDSFSSPMAEQISTIVITNNSALQNINFSSLTSVDNLEVDTNSGGTTLSMEALWTAGNLSFANLGNLDIPRLGYCSGTLEFTNNNVLDLQLGNISRVMNNLVITNNPSLNSLNLTRLISVGSGYGGYMNRVPNNGSLIITGNGQLNEFKNFLVSVYGNMYLNGPWSDHLFLYVSWVGGNFDLETTDTGVTPKYDCGGLVDQVQSNDLTIVSSFTCNGVTASNTPQAGSGGMATGTKVGIGVGVAAAVVAVVFTCWFCRHRKSKRDKQKKNNANINSLDSLPFSRVSDPIPYSPDLQHNSRPATLDPGRQPIPPSRPSRQPSWPSAGLPLSTELGLDINERSSSDNEETNSLSQHIGEARMHQETGMEQTAPSSGMMAGTEQLPRYDEPPPEYKP